jgi:metallo-beta-lactamase class B
VTIVTTPGNTSGTLSMLFTVKDNGRTINVAFSQGKMAAAAAAANTTILMSNHSEFDNAVQKIRMRASLKPGELHPFEVEKETVAQYFTVTRECAQAARLKAA